MSMYGPPGGPYPGQPQDPWEGGGPNDPYGQQGASHDHWGGAPASGGPYDQQPPPQHYEQYPPPSYAAPESYPQPSYQPPAGGEGWGPPPRRSNTALIVTVVVALAVLVCGGGVTGLYLLNKSNSAKTPAANRSKPAQSAAPTQEATTPPAAGTGGTAPITAQVGDCLVNDGTDERPKMRQVQCAANSFEVVKRIPKSTNSALCENVSGYTHNYIYDTSPDDNDFVLCLKQRK